MGARESFLADLPHAQPVSGDKTRTQLAWSMRGKCAWAAAVRIPRLGPQAAGGASGSSRCRPRRRWGGPAMILGHRHLTRYAMERQRVALAEAAHGRLLVEGAALLRQLGDPDRPPAATQRQQAARPRFLAETCLAAGGPWGDGLATPTVTRQKEMRNAGHALPDARRVGGAPHPPGGRATSRDEETAGQVRPRDTRAAGRDGDPERRQTSRAPPTPPARRKTTGPPPTGGCRHRDRCNPPAAATSPGVRTNHGDTTQGVTRWTASASTT